jgi:hypothetical protein
MQKILMQRKSQQETHLSLMPAIPNSSHQCHDGSPSLQEQGTKKIRKGIEDPMQQKRNQIKERNREAYITLQEEN